MSDSKHTPGPWAYRPLEYDDWGFVRSGEDFICQARDPRVCSEEDLALARAERRDPWAANGHLIAAAPEMYEALALLIQYGEWQIHEGASHHPTLPSAVAKARAALTKAEGR